MSLALLALVYIFSFIDRQVLSILLEPIKQEFGASDTEMGLLTGLAFGLIYAVLGVPVGRIADTKNRRNIVAVCCGVWSLATAACGFATQYWHMLVARMSVAVGEAGGMAPSISIVSDLYPPKMRSFAISLFMMGPNLGTLLGLVIGGMVAQYYGWRSVFLAFGIPGVILALLVYFFVKEPVRGAYEAQAAKTAEKSTEPRESMMRQVKRLLSMAPLRNICLACGAAGIAGYGYGVWAPSFFMRIHGMSISHAGLVFGLASGLGAVFGAMFCGWLSDKLTQRDARWQLRLAAIGTFCAVPAGIAVFFWPVSDFWTVAGIKVPYAMAFALVFGFFASWFATLSYSAISQMVTAKERSVAAALLNLFMTLLGVGLGPLVTGMLSDYFSQSHGAEGLRWALMSVVSILILTVLFFALAINPYKQRLQQLQSAAT
ncbi:MFS transporter [Comamonas sp. Y33R10-2]|uniref:spinster family MFS transporter n=1 Tax=Comamonas sp. Y33R10-2 TaxID=2853257 RepID=UPI001C5C96C2|nr:MFS transporter [Comamonas sp. Y33R10-2]QXZ08496.1 MFS transporter [Comamonas sp. Y33R10-2]